MSLKWAEITPEEKRRVQAAWQGHIVNDVIRYENGVVMSRKFTTIADKIYNFPLRESDIWIVSYPKSGTTWAQEMVWMLVNDVNKKTANVPQFVRSPYLEMNMFWTTEFFQSQDIKIEDETLVKALEDPIDYAKQMTGRRVIKTHLPKEFLPPGLIEKCKVIYVARNPKDTAVSYYKINCWTPGHDFVGTFDDFMTLFVEELHAFGYFWHLLLTWWREKEHPNIRFLWFEDMKKDQKSVIEDLCQFLNHPLSTEQIDALVSHVDFENMSKNPMANPMSGLTYKPKSEGQFMRKGEVGDWKNFFSSERTEKWNKWIEKNIEGTGLEKLNIF